MRLLLGPVCFPYYRRAVKARVGQHWPEGLDLIIQVRVSPKTKITDNDQCQPFKHLPTHSPPLCRPPPTLAHAYSPLTYLATSY